MPRMISACIVAFNEEKVIEKCLKSIVNLVNEIIVVHDGECSDKTLEISQKYGAKTYIRPHIGIAEPHRSFSYEMATGEWILQVDADEYIDESDIPKIKNLIEGEVDAYHFKWELWDGKKPVHFKGLKKMTLFKKSKIRFQGIPQTVVSVEGEVRDADVFLRHRPLYNNVSWETANKKRDYWLRSHVIYFFPEKVDYQCFKDNPDSWIDYTKKVRSRPFFYIIFYPLKNFFGQLRNGLWSSWVGVNIALQQYVYYLSLYYRVWKMSRSK